MNQGAIAKAVAVVGLTVLVDQVTKAIAVASLERGQEVNVFLGLDMTYVRNEGVAFGALSGGGPLLVIVIAVAASRADVAGQDAQLSRVAADQAAVLGSDLGRLVAPAR